MSKRVRRTGRWNGVVLSMALLAMTPAVWAAAPTAAASTGATGYELPSAALQAVVDQPRAPGLFLSPQGHLAAMLQMPPLPSIEVVAQPELKLASVGFCVRVPHLSLHGLVDGGLGCLNAAGVVNATLGPVSHGNCPPWRNWDNV